MARFLKIGGIVFAIAAASAAAPAFAGARHAGGGYGGHMVVHAAAPGMAVHGGVVYNHPRDTFPQGYGYGYAPPRGRQGYDYGYALPHGRPGYDYGYALPYGGGYRGWGYGGAAYGGGGYYYDPGYGAYDAGTAPGAIIILPTTAIYGPPYPVGYYGGSYAPTGNGVIYNLPVGPQRYTSKIIFLSDRHGQAQRGGHVTVIRGGVVSEE